MPLIINSISSIDFYVFSLGYHVVPDSGTTGRYLFSGLVLGLPVIGTFKQAKRLLLETYTEHRT